MFTKELRQYFFQDNSTQTSPGDRFVSGHEPTQNTMEHFVGSVGFLLEKGDKARTDQQGFVRLVSDANARSNTNPTNDWSYAAQPSQLPTVEAQDAASQQSDEPVDNIEVTVDPNTATRNNFLVRIKSGFVGWIISRMLPGGGSSGQTLAKNSNSDYDVGWVDTNGLPAGGAQDEVLAKNSSSNYDADFKNPLNIIPGYSGPGQKGLVPDPVTNNGYFLRDDGQWVNVDTSGEANTASNVGGQKEFFKQKSGQDLEFRTLQKQGKSFVTITQGANVVTLNVSDVPSGDVQVQGVSYECLNPNSDDLSTVLQSLFTKVCAIDQVVNAGDMAGTPQSYLFCAKKQDSQRLLFNTDSLNVTENLVQFPDDQSAEDVYDPGGNWSGFKYIVPGDYNDTYFIVENIYVTNMSSSGINLASDLELVIVLYNGTSTVVLGTTLIRASGGTITSGETIGPLNQIAYNINANAGDEIYVAIRYTPSNAEESGLTVSADGGEAKFYNAPLNS